MQGGMMMRDEGLEISSEAELFDLIRRINENDPDLMDFDGQIRFGDWAKVVVIMRGPQFSGTITPTVMKAFLDLQKGINRSYSLVTYGQVQRLSKEERDALEIKVEVGQGSSTFSINFQSVLEIAAKHMVDKMTGTQLLVGVIFLGATWATQSVLKRHLNNRKEIRLAELRSEEERARIEGMVAMKKEEKEHAKIYAELLARNTAYRAVDEEVQASTEAMVKALSSADSGSIGDVSIDQDQAATLSSNARERSDEVRLDGVYRVTTVSSKDPTEFKIEVFNTDTRENFRAVVQETSMNRSNRSVLEQAIFERKPVRLEINANNRRGQIVDAVVMRAEAHEPDAE